VRWKPNSTPLTHRLRINPYQYWAAVNRRPPKLDPVDPVPRQDRACPKSLLPISNTHHAAVTDAVVTAAVFTAAAGAAVAIAPIGHGHPRWVHAEPRRQAARTQPHHRRQLPLASDGDAYATGPSANDAGEVRMRGASCGSRLVNPRWTAPRTSERRLWSTRSKPTAKVAETGLWSDASTSCRQ